MLLFYKSILKGVKMRKIIKGKVYDTDTAIELFKKGTTDCRTTNFNDWFE